MRTAWSSLAFALTALAGTASPVSAQASAWLTSISQGSGYAYNIAALDAIDVSPQGVTVHSASGNALSSDALKNAAFPADAAAYLKAHSAEWVELQTAGVPGGSRFVRARSIANVEFAASHVRVRSGGGALLGESADQPSIQRVRKLIGPH